MTSAEPLLPLKILLVEDNQDTLRFFSFILSQRGHEVRKAANLLQARAMLTDDLDLLISDIELPDGSGLELIRELCGRSLPAIAMSGFGSTEDIEVSLKAGFAAHLTKPIEIHRLEASIRQVIASVDGVNPTFKPRGPK
jgi:DNA-binding response OmpR family regulator